MDKFKADMVMLWERAGIWIIIAIALVATIALIISGYSYYYVVLMCLAVLLTLVGGTTLWIPSAIIGIFVKVLAGPLTPLYGAIFGGSAHEKFFSTLEAANFFAVIAMIFLALYVIDRLLGYMRQLLAAFKPVEHRHHTKRSVNHHYHNVRRTQQ